MWKFVWKSVGKFVLGNYPSGKRAIQALWHSACESERNRGKRGKRGKRRRLVVVGLELGPWATRGPPAGTPQVQVAADLREGAINQCLPHWLADAGTMKAR